MALGLFAPFFFAGVVLYAALPGWIAFLSIQLPDWLRSVAVVVGILGVTFAIWGYRTLGRNWVHALDPSKFKEKENEVLVTTGPYRYVRNPIYLGAFSLVVAQGLVAANWLVLLPALAIVPPIYAQVDNEEAMLIQRFGDSYREYMNRTPRLFPRFWRRKPRTMEGNPEEPRETAARFFKGSNPKGRDSWLT